GDGVDAGHDVQVLGRVSGRLGAQRSGVERRERRALCLLSGLEHARLERLHELDGDVVARLELLQVLDALVGGERHFGAVLADQRDHAFLLIHRLHLGGVLDRMFGLDGRLRFGGGGERRERGRDQGGLVHGWLLPRTRTAVNEWYDSPCPSPSTESAPRCAGIPLPSPGPGREHWAWDREPTTMRWNASSCSTCPSSRC